MLGIKKETDYAIQFLKILAKNNRHPVSLGEITDKTGISFLFLQKIARKLRFAGLIIAARGARGGYDLALPATKINLKKIVEVMEGGSEISGCLCDQNLCPTGKKNCVLRGKLKKINKTINDLLAKTKLKQL